MAQEKKRSIGGPNDYHNEIIDGKPVLLEGLGDVQYPDRDPREIRAAGTARLEALKKEVEQAGEALTERERELLKREQELEERERRLASQEAATAARGKRPASGE